MSVEPAPIVLERVQFILVKHGYPPDFAWLGADQAGIHFSTRIKPYVKWRAMVAAYPPGCCFPCLLNCPPNTPMVNYCEHTAHLVDPALR